MNKPNNSSDTTISPDASCSGVHTNQSPSLPQSFKVLVGWADTNSTLSVFVRTSSVGVKFIRVHRIDHSNPNASVYPSSLRVSSVRK